jgi:uncharacterized protein YdcH (DUF465 family)
MKVTLRKANALQNVINDAIKSIDTPTNVTVNEFKDPEVAIKEGRETLLANVERKNKLLGALYSIRKDVGASNAVAGIDERLAQVALTEKRIQLYTNLAGLSVREDAEVIAGKLLKIKNRPAEARSPYGYSDEITTTVVGEADMAEFKSRIAQLKKEKQKLQDEILEVNVRTEVDLNDIVVTDVLRAEGLL